MSQPMAPWQHSADAAGPNGSGPQPPAGCSRPSQTQQATRRRLDAAFEPAHRQQDVPGPQPFPPCTEYTGLVPRPSGIPASAETNWTQYLDSFGLGQLC